MNYVTKPPRLLWIADDTDGFADGIEKLDVIVHETEAQQIGLLNADGQPLYRQPDRVVFGFRGSKG